MVQKRVDMVDMSRSLTNTIVIDSGLGGDNGETYDLKSTSFAGLTDLVTKFESALSAVSGIPKSLLFGDQSSGLNAGDKVGLENWYAHVSQRQELILLNPLDRLITLIMKSMGIYTPDYLVKFLPLYVPNDKDIAEVEYKRAQTREIYAGMMALDPSEIRAKLAGEGYDIDEVEVIKQEPDTEEEM
jgi:phage-related protein (TIGR01555 family)